MFCPLSRPDRHFRADGYFREQLADIVVFQRDTAFCIPPAVALAVDHDLAAEFRIPGRLLAATNSKDDLVELPLTDNPSPHATLGVFNIRITQPQRKNVLRTGIANADVKRPLGRAMIAFAGFVSPAAADSSPGIASQTSAHQKRSGGVWTSRSLSEADADSPTQNRHTEHYPAG